MQHFAYTNPSVGLRRVPTIPDFLLWMGSGGAATVGVCRGLRASHEIPRDAD